jgi:hypothetical protein
VTFIVSLDAATGGGFVLLVGPADLMTRLTAAQRASWEGIGGRSFVLGDAIVDADGDLAAWLKRTMQPPSCCGQISTSTAPRATRPMSLDWSQLLGPLFPDLTEQRRCNACAGVAWRTLAK